MLRKTLLLVIFLALTSTALVYSEELIRKTDIISKDPYIVVLKFYADKNEIAQQKYRLYMSSPEGSSFSLPKWILLESQGQISDGLVKEYYPSGRVLYEIQYNEGKKHGLAKEYFEEGQLKSEVSYVDGKVQGFRKEYYPSGTLYESISFKDDQRDGVFSQYLENGKLAYTTLFKKGEPTQTVTLFDYYDDGSLKKEYYHNEFGEIPRILKKEYYRNGQLALEATLNDDGTLIIKEYDEKGNLISEKGNDSKLENSSNVLENVEKDENYPYVGFWKTSCEHNFGYVFEKADEGLYYVRFCGPGGCFQKASLPKIDLATDSSFQIKDENTIIFTVGDEQLLDEEIKRRTKDGKIILKRCSE